MIGMILFAKPILKLLFPNATSGSFIYQISCLSIIFIVLEQTICGALHGLGKMMIPAISLGIGVAIKLILNLILVPINPNEFILGGTAGAAFATTICHMISVAIQFNFLKKEIKLKLDKKKFVIKPLVACLAMGVISYNLYLYLIVKLGSQNIATILSLLIAIAIYIVMIILLKIFSKEEIYMIPYGKKIYDFFENLKPQEKPSKPAITKGFNNRKTCILTKNWDSKKKINKKRRILKNNDE